MKTIHRKRLLKLATHLERGKLGHTEFYFGAWNGNTLREQLKRNGCGFCGCAIGECPVVFKQSWKWSKGLPRLRKRLTAEFVYTALTALRDDAPYVSARVFFRLTDEQASHLFLPNHQLNTIYGGERLGRDATRQQVAANIRSFLKATEPEA